MIKYISSQETLPLRSKMLRDNSPLANCLFPTDDIDGAFHLGFFMNEQIVTVASFFPKQYQDRAGLGYQLRGMATDSEFAGKGYGAKLMDFAISELNALKAAYLWCNARSGATQFYQKKGFKLVSSEFEIEDVGPHYEMILNLNII
ncbi:GNAT family N-acetyltransferase [Pedobacter insulae]|uniref:Predicted N-acyltransferase, GNAT family n=1 Tax=Pedobacter insulae TaxID=414048 RepID=A0A1I2VU85_9SPHI|nr:GNAT family N-acetyltransferase [Pedobacter insulae]SFG92814.1 Predicted N-acyltransferase, GNAT family [Pedobacter insulae]